MKNIQKITEFELLALKNMMMIDPIKFKDDLIEIEQELTIRQLSFCKPICDIIIIQEEFNDYRG